LVGVNERGRSCNKKKKNSKKGDRSLSNLMSKEEGNQEMIRCKQKEIRGPHLILNEVKQKRKKGEESTFFGVGGEGGERPTGERRGASRKKRPINIIGTWIDIGGNLWGIHCSDTRFWGKGKSKIQRGSAALQIFRNIEQCQKKGIDYSTSKGDRTT